MKKTVKKAAPKAKKATPRETLLQTLLANNKKPIVAKRKETPQAIEIKRVLGRSSFGCQTKNVYKIVSALLGQEIVAPDDGGLKVGMVYRSVKNGNSHDYYTSGSSKRYGMTFVATNDTQGIKPDGRWGNNISTSYARRATPAEIAAYVTALPEKAVKLVLSRI